MMGLEPASVDPSVRHITLSNMNISETSEPVAIKFYLKHYLGKGKAALGFLADRLRTLVSMVTDIFQRVIMGKTASPRFLSCFNQILFILAGENDIHVHKSLHEFRIRPNPITDSRVSCP